MKNRGIGGVFFKSENPERLKEWYGRHFGFEEASADDDAVVLNWRDYEDPGEVGQTIWSPFPADTDYFDPSDSEWMLNIRVADLDATLDRLAESGAEIVGEVHEFDYGRFGWVLDPEDNKVELWEPPDAAAFPGGVPSRSEVEFDGTFAAPPSTSVAAAGDLSDRSIEKMVEVDLSVAEVWRLWTTGEGMAEWWVESNEIELRVGGPMELYMLPDGPEGARGSEDCRILSFLPERMLSFTWNAPPQFEYTRPRHTHVVVEFEPLDADRTRLELHHLGWPDDDWDAHPEWAETYAYFDQAWEQVMEMLADYAETGGSEPD